MGSPAGRECPSNVMLGCVVVELILGLIGLQEALDLPVGTYKVSAIVAEDMRWAPPSGCKPGEGSQEGLDGQV